MMKKMLVIAALVATCIALPVAAAAPVSSTWYRTWGTARDESATAICGNGTSIYVVGSQGNTWSDTIRLVLVKWDFNGTRLYDTSWGTLDEDVFPAASAWCDASTVYTCGYVETEISGHYDDLFLVKWNATGELLWNRTWGTEMDDQAMASWSDGGDVVYVCVDVDTISGSRDDDMVLMKVDKDGNSIWNRTVNYSPADDHAAAAWGLGADVYTFGVTERSWYAHDYLLVKWNSSGDIVWNRTWDCGDANEDIASCMWGDSSAIYTCGRTTSGSQSIPTIVKWDHAGNVIWAKTYPSWRITSVTSIWGDDTGIYIAGSSYDEDRGYDIYVYKLDRDGGDAWQRSWGTPHPGVESASTILVSGDDLFTAGYTHTRVNYDDELLVVKWGTDGAAPQAPDYADAVTGLSIYLTVSNVAAVTAILIVRKRKKGIQPGKR
nr:hypothetical protein [Candidatus Sigynarchaeota archaeon]